MQNPLRPRDPRKLTAEDIAILEAVKRRPGSHAAEIAADTTPLCRCWTSRVQKVSQRLEALGLIERRRERRQRMDGSALYFVCFYPKEAGHADM